MFRTDPSLHGVRVAKYIRCSSERQARDGETLEAQEQILDEFIAANHCVLVDTFIDEGLTARKRFSKRKEINRLLECVKRHEFDLIIFTKLDRWFRNIGDYHKIQEVLEAHNVQWKAVTENYDTTTTNGRLYVNIRLSVAQDEADRTSDRIKDVFHYKLANKTYISGTTPRGLMLDEEKHVVPDPKEKQFALDAFDFFETTGSLRQTHTMLCEKYDDVLLYSSMGRYMNNPLLKGQFRDDPEFCEPLIDPDRFDRIQVLMKKNLRIRKNHRIFVFTGLVQCAECGGSMPGTSTRPANDEGKYYYYRCLRHYQEKTCPHRGSVSQQHLEEYLIEHIQPELDRYTIQYEIRTAADREKDPEVEKEKIRKKMKKLRSLLLDDLILREDYEEEYRELEERMKKLDHIKVTKPRSIEQQKTILAEGWKEIYKQLKPGAKNAFWKSIIDHIEVDCQQNIEIFFL